MGSFDFLTGDVAGSSSSPLPTHSSSPGPFVRSNQFKMDSLPNEFLSHHLPLMFFAGIGPSNSVKAEAIAEIPSQVNDQFETLIEYLRAALSHSTSPSPIWNPPKNRQIMPDFRVVLVDKAIRFPPRKARPSSISTATNATLHSPLSPLSDTSPLFPDGLITPIWIRKHRDMVPSIFVLTFKLWEPLSISQRDLSNQGFTSDKTKRQEEFEQSRHNDQQLICEIVERKKSTSERGIKLAVIILTSRYMLDHPDLDARLSYIRKQSALDSRASLFVLSPVPMHDMRNFVNTLKTELYESAIDYYREHSRRVRRKRSRANSSISLHSTSYHQPGQPIITPLGPQGWSVRSDYKLATFAEFRQEFEVAIKSYEDSWEGLIQMFSSTAILPPRTKRWAEAKVLTDCISFKICKLYLYSTESSRAMYQFNKHIHRFRDLCNGWGIGEETFEFWAWLSKQYAILADLIDVGCRNGMRLPNLLPLLSPVPEKSLRSGSPVPENGAHTTPHGAWNLTNVLFHPGFYYYQSAECAVERLDRFLASETAEDQMLLIAKAKGKEAEFRSSPVLAHEKKVNHAELIIGLYTKAYEIFKTAGSSRMTLFLALKIARIHFDQKDYRTSYKFFQKILTSYRKEKYDPVVHTVLYLCHLSIKKDLNWDKAMEVTQNAADQPEVLELLKLSLEILAKEEFALSNDDRADLCHSIASLTRPLSESGSSGKSDITLALLSSAFPVRFRLAFWSSWIEFGEEVEFQLLMKIPELLADCQMSFSSIELQFSLFPPIKIVHQDDEVPSVARTIDLGVLSEQPITYSSNLQIMGQKSLWVLTGRLKPPRIGKIYLEEIQFRSNITLGGTFVALLIKPDSAEDRSDNRLQWIQGFDHIQHQPIFVGTEDLQSVCFVQPKEPRVAISLDCPTYGLTNKEQSMMLEIHNQESEPLHPRLNVKLQSPGPGDVLAIEEQTLSGLTEAVELSSIKPGAMLRKAFIFHPSWLVGPRKLHLAFTTEVKTERECNNNVASQEHFCSRAQITKTAVIEVEDPFDVSFHTQFLNQSQFSASSFELHQFNPCQLSLAFAFTVIIKCNPRKTLNLSKIEFSAPSSFVIKSTSLPDQKISDCNIELERGTSFTLSYLGEIFFESFHQESFDSFLKVSWACSSDLEKQILVKEIPFLIERPALQPTIALTNLPLYLVIYQPFDIIYEIENRSQKHTLDVYVQVDPSDQWVFSGPRRLDNLLILPRSSRSFSLTAIPVMIGHIEGPNVQIYERVQKHRLGKSECSSYFISAIENVEDVDEEDDENENTEDFIEIQEIEIVRHMSIIEYNTAEIDKSPVENSKSTPATKKIKKPTVMIIPA
ncbi:hypothetical protein O181_036850 [Austropuccinia psidii MF-1]|uniref:Trafficking protein particle complex subunit 11 domain-containing protein n=1 Tax=Austropuccinia psidii MF-1 TaxID=1389203 RepID=A0A9Q3D9Q4_9BASI|nr:hypothetical protein [Austropuccinia psidii MF-1]